MSGDRERKPRGRRGGRKPKLSGEDLAKADIAISGGFTITEVARLIGVSRQTLHRYLARRAAQL